jgi:hypothetical protein
VLLLEGPIVSSGVVVWQVSVPCPRQTGAGAPVHRISPPDLVQEVVPVGHVLQLAASAAVVPNANNDIEVSNNNEGTRDMELSVNRLIGGRTG